MPTITLRRKRQKASKPECQQPHALLPELLHELPSIEHEQGVVSPSHEHLDVVTLSTRRILFGAREKLNGDSKK
jgi:hypothetical protein